MSKQLTYEELINVIAEAGMRVESIAVALDIACVRFRYHYITADDIVRMYVFKWLDEFGDKVFEDPEKLVDWIVKAPRMLINPNDIFIELLDGEVYLISVRRKDVQDFDKCAEAYSKLNDAITTLIKTVKEVVRG